MIFKTSIPFLSLTSGQGKGQHRHGGGLTALDGVLSGSDINRKLSHESDLLILVINKIAKKAQCLLPKYCLERNNGVGSMVMRLAVKGKDRRV